MHQRVLTRKTGPPQEIEGEPRCTDWNGQGIQTYRATKDENLDALKQALHFSRSFKRPPTTPNEYRRGPHVYRFW
ncbi:hypothetical protein GCM10007359_21300 [Rothia aerolata]|uniref:Uncharacterized protein n=1 Tax=Rothia aerolata TaxID=1812262 RepID=A0A917IZZ2_9MICC|nr:hypothetical protein GCM10007359_21300 [Rothia aerolata]